MNIITEIDEVISELNGLKNKYPKMETQAVIDLIGRLKDKVKKNVVLDNVIDCDSPVKTVAFIETKEGINVYYKGEQVLKNGTNEDVNKLNLHNR